MSAINDMEAENDRHILKTWTCPYCFRKLDDIPPSEGISPKDHIWNEESDLARSEKCIYIPAAHRPTFVALINKVVDKALNWILDRFLKKHEYPEQTIERHAYEASQKLISFNTLGPKEYLEALTILLDTQRDAVADMYPRDTQAEELES